MKTKVSIIIALFIAFAIGGCNYSQNKEKKANKKEVIRIGVILPLTGELSSYGAPIIEGIKMAVKNDTLSKYRLNLDISDSKGEARTAVNIVSYMLNIKNIKYFIGDVSSPVTLAIIPLIEKNNALLMCPGASSPKLDNISKTFIRNYPSSSSESKESADFILDSLKKNVAGIVYVNNDYGIGLKEAFEKRFRQKGGIIGFSEKYEYGNSNFKNIIVKIKNSNVNVIYLGGNPKEMGHFVKQLREYREKLLIVSNISFLTKDCLNIAGVAANGVIVPVAYYNPNNPNDQGVKKFTHLYFKKYKKQPSVLNAVGYDAANLIIMGINDKGNNPRIVASFLREYKNYNGALGNLSFEKGEVHMPIIFKYIDNGKPKILNNMNTFLSKYGNKF